MKTRDLVADLISEIADETNHSACKFESIAPSTGHIAYINDAPRDEKVEEYKILDYVGDIIYMWGNNLSRVEVDLKNPDSIDIVKSWFLDHSHAYDNPAGVNRTTTGFNYSGTLTIPVGLKGQAPGGGVTISGGGLGSSGWLGTGGAMTITSGDGCGWASTTTTSGWAITKNSTTFKNKNGI